MSRSLSSLCERNCVRHYCASAIAFVTTVRAQFALVTRAGIRAACWPIRATLPTTLTTSPLFRLPDPQIHTLDR